jgi:beta-galactosidase GanA
MTASDLPKHGDAGPIVPKVPHVLYGADYNSEQWDRDVWREAVRLTGS